MFFEALKAAFIQDSIFLGTSILAMLAAVIIIFFCFRNGNFHYYSDFKKVFFFIAGTWFVIGAGTLAAALIIQAKTIPLNTIKGDKAEIRSAVQKDYEDAIKKADTQAKKDAVKNQYTDNGFSLTKTGKLVVNETSRISKELLDWIKMRANMEKSGGYSIKIPGINKVSSGPSLNEKLNAKAVKMLNFMRFYRFYAWFSLLCIACIIMLISGIITAGKGTAEQIEDELENQ